MQRVHLHAQTHAADFYRKAGFLPAGGEFMEAGIPHQAMTLELPIPFQPPGDLPKPAVRPETSEREAAPASELEQLHGEADCRRGLLKVLERPRRHLSILSHQLDHALFDAEDVVDAISRFARMRAPIVAAVNGTAAGAGFSMVCATDLAIAADHAKLTMAYTGAGLSPDGSSSYFLPRIIGQRRTFELMLTNRVLTAAEALDWGLLNEVVPADELMATAEKRVAQLASGPTNAHAVVKRLLATSATESLETQMEHETRGIAECARTADGREGITAFLEKRKPSFEGA